MTTTKNPTLAALLAGAFLLGAPKAPLAAQNRIKDEDVVLKTVRPEHVQFRELQTLVNELYGRELWFEDGRRTRNILLGTDSIIIYEEKENMAKILDTIAMLDVAEPADAELTISVYKPQHAAARTLHELARQLFGRQIQDAAGGAKSNVSLAGDTIVVNDSAEAAKGIVEKLAYLDESFARPEGDSNARLETFEYRPHALNLRVLENTLQSFRRTIEIAPAGPGIPPAQAPNISAVHEQGILIVRDTPENLAVIQEMLEKIDKPPQQAMLTCFVLSARADGQGNAPAVLASALKKLLPYESYRVDATGLVRVSTQPGRRVGITMTASNDPHDPRAQSVYQLNAVIGAWDPDGKSLLLESCNVTASGPTGSRQMFETTTSIFAGEYAVLGVAGGDPLFVVLRVTPVDGGKVE